jgi:hypothetical protein
LQRVQCVAPYNPSALLGCATRCTHFQHRSRAGRQIRHTSITVNREPIRHEVHARVLLSVSRRGTCKNAAHRRDAR